MRGVLCVIAFAVLICSASAEASEDGGLETLDPADPSLEMVAAKPKEPSAVTELVDEGAQAQVSLEAKTAAKTQGKAGAMVKIFDKTFSMSKVSAVKAQFRRVLHAVGKRHPELLGEAATLSHFSGESEDKIEGGFSHKGLAKVVARIDGVEKELIAERDLAKKQRKQREQECNQDIKTSEKNIRDSQASLRNQKVVMDGHKNDIKALHKSISDSENMEGGGQTDSYESIMKMKRDEITKRYKEHWAGSDERAEVRNVLMQAMWLVCYGFRSFRQDPFCVTLRKQPDFAEPGEAQKEAKGENYRRNTQISDVFANTMKSVWNEQMLADMHMVNRNDGDADMEKGFVNNKAPWGVDPAEERQTETLLQTQVGLSDKQGATLDNKAMSERLNFLLRSSDAPVRATAPIQGFVNALEMAQGNEQTAAIMETGQGMVSMLASLDRKTGQEQAEADKAWEAAKKSLHEEAQVLSRSMMTEASTQDKSTEEVGRLKEKMRFIKEGVRDHERSETAEAKEMRKTLEACERDYVEFDARIEVAEEELVNVQRLNSLLRFLALGQDPKPKCTAASGTPCDKGDEHGTCTWKTRGKDDPKGPTNKDAVFCACEYGWYGTNCELRKCKGFGKILYRADQDGVCHNRGGDCKGTLCENTGCDTKDGSCTCSVGHYHGPLSSCEMKYCPKRVDSNGNSVFASSTSDTMCGGTQKGKCDSKRGKCLCQPDYWGPHCGYKKCPASSSGKIIGRFRGTSPNACDGRGACDSKTGQCKCGGDHFYGEACQLSHCGGGSNDKNQCSGKGTCQPKSGLCVCNKGATGGDCTLCRDCKYKTCKAKCGETGYCDRLSGKCTCYKGNYNGAQCKEPCRHEAYNADWSRSFDKWGWSVCKFGWLLTGMKRDGRGSALYNIQQARCEKPCEGNKENIKITHCYHENWWKAFDTKGGKFCRRNYFVAGLFRSHCNSLYCLEMAKCCQVKKSVWQDCSWVSATNWKRPHEWMKVQGKQAFIAGFYRGSIHTLDSIQWIRQCVPIFWGADKR
jgi:hypothetical protein